MLLVSRARPSIMRHRRRTSGFGNSRWEQPTRTSRGVVGVQDAQGTRTVGRIAQSPVFRALLQVATTCRPSYGRSDFSSDPSKHKPEDSHDSHYLWLRGITPLSNFDQFITQKKHSARFDLATCCQSVSLGLLRRRSKTNQRKEPQYPNKKHLRDCYASVLNKLARESED